MSVWGAVTTLIVAGLCAVSLPRYWRGDPRAIEAPEPWGLMSPGVWRGTKRAVPVLAPTIIVTFIAGTVMFSLRTNSPAFGVCVYVVAMVILIGCSLWATITLFNRPRVLVPPAMRADSGLLAERRAARGSGRHRRVR